MARAPRLPSCRWPRIARCVLPALCLWLTGSVAAVACEQPPWIGVAMEGSLTQLRGVETPAPGPVAAWYEDPTTRYAHGVLGDAIEAGTLVAQLDDFPNCITGRITLPQSEVFEDTAPRLADLDGDGHAEIIVVQSSASAGARLAVYGLSAAGDGLELRAATPPIGRPNRWLAPIGAADLDGDGAIEIAYIDRPHLARTLRVWRYESGRLTEVAHLPGLTNHRIGDPTIPGGIRDCGDGPEMITASADWSRVIATRLTADGTLVPADLGAWSPGALAAALSCPD